SATLKLVLEMAYATSILVGAAGNNRVPIGPCTVCAPMYPGAYNYVLGVEDRPRPLLGYTNFDQDGPIYTRYQNLLNYEIAAPGTGIMSTIPGGGYATLTGTSMSTPLVAGGLALYNQIKPNDSKELLFGNLINTTDFTGSDSATGMPGFIDLLDAIEVVPEPRLYLLEPTSRDTINSQNGNGFWEPGETIEILPLVKNYWGPTEDVRVGIEFAEFEDQTKATIVQNEIEIGSISAYATLQDLEETLKITISEGVANNVDIKFNIRVWSGPDQEYISEPVEFILSVTNAIIFTDYITEDMTLTNDRIWIFQNSMVVTNGATLTIEPGTTVRISENSRVIIDSDSYLYANGTSSSPITIESDDSGYWRGVMYEDPITNTDNNYLNYTNFNISNYNSIEDVIEANPSYWGNVIFNYTVFKEWGTSSQWYGTYFVGPVIYNNCQFREFYFGWAFLWGGNAYFNESNFDEGVYVTKMIKNNFKSTGSSHGAFINNVNVTNLDYWGTVGDITVGYDGLFTIDERYNHSNFYDPMVTVGLNIFDIFNMDYWSGDDQGPLQMEPTYQDNMGSSIQGVGTFNFPNKIWFGSESEDVLRTKFWDYSTSQFYNGLIDYSTRATGPSEDAHGIVWKVEVNGFNAQDDYSTIEPLGIGENEFKIYFNREMDTSVNPQVFYGVRIPYTQNIITEQGTWSSDGKIYTVTHEVNIGAADGINRIRVQDAQDLDYFKIPVEDSRFNFLLQSAGSASTGFLAQGGLGKIDLEWTAPSTDELDDVLGYNMYRYQVDTDGVESEPVQLNESLIIEDTDESTTGVYFTDYEVVEGETYFYKYKILRTSFEETDYSNAVSSAPLTSTLGDSNGDFSVNVMDLVQNVDYILGNNPPPFIFVAADVNADETINVLDIVGTVDIIL
ncbi:MAG: S8 family serine peptidase, partial [Hellea sp.]|nr:S8 family serine peptidase [Hellea sp.]